MKKPRFQFPVLMATSMMAMSPMTVWAEDVAGMTPAEWRDAQRF